MTARTSSELYHADLAHIHIAGFGFHWQRAAPAIRAMSELLSTALDQLIVGLSR